SLETRDAQPHQQALARFPDLAGELQAFFADQGQVEALASHIREFKASIPPCRLASSQYAPGIRLSAVPPRPSFGNYKLQRILLSKLSAVQTRGMQETVDGSDDPAPTGSRETVEAPKTIPVTLPRVLRGPGLVLP